MSKTSSKPGFLKYLTYSAASVITAAGILALAQTQHALDATSPGTSMLRGTASMLLPATHDYWHTRGNQILDRHNEPVRIAGVNWSGFETREAVLGGLDAQDYQVILRQIRKNGFNTVRIPFSNEMIETPSVPSGIRFQNAEGSINSDLRNLTSVQILDKIVTCAGKVGLKIILDNHRSEAGSSAEENGLWYTMEYPESAWIEDWTTLARRYENDSTVIGMDLRNEPHLANQGGSCWDCGGTRDWHLAAERAGNAVLSVNPRLLIFVEGVDSYGDDTSWWGGNLEGVRRSHVHLSVPGRLVYSVHEYGPVEYAQPWFNASTSAATLTALWRRRWAYISEAAIAPVWVGEFGTPHKNTDVQSSLAGSEGQWFSCLVEFLRSHPSLGWTYWGINAEDQYGLLNLHYLGEPDNPMKLEALSSIINPHSDTHLRRPEVATTPVSARQAVPPPYRPRMISPASRGVNLEIFYDPEQRSERRSEAANIPASSTERDDVKSTIGANVRQAVRNANSTLTPGEENRNR